MTDAERAETWRLWSALDAQYGKFLARCADMYARRDTPDWEERDRRTQRSGERFGQMRDELAQWCGVPACQVVALLGEVWEVDR